MKMHITISEKFSFTVFLLAADPELSAPSRRKR